MQIHILHALHAKNMTKPRIKVDVERASSIRVSNRTREMLSSLARGTETHEEVILRLIKQDINLSSEEGTQIIPKGNAMLLTCLFKACKSVSSSTPRLTATAP